MRTRIISFVFLFMLSGTVLAQDNGVIFNRAYMVFSGGTSSNPATLMVNQTNGLGIITYSPAVGGLISEGEYNQVKWGIQTAEGSYSIPYTSSTSASAVAIPFTLSVTASGTGNGNIIFSTFKTNYTNTTRPSDVTNMTGTNTGADNSLYVVDRFWIADADGGYSTKPTIGGMVFTYTDAELAGYGGSNTITESNLQAQRFDEAGSWDGWGPAGIASPASNYVTSTSVSPANFFRSWVLVDQSSPLPIELLFLKGTCTDDKVILNWITASEINNDFFTLEKSLDGINFVFFAIVDGAGNSNSNLNYTATDFNPYSGTSYYRLMQTDFDGTTKYSEPITVAACETKNPVAVTNAFSNGSGDVIVQINSPSEKQYDIGLYDLKGSRLISEQKNVAIGQNEYRLNIVALSKGIYLVAIRSATSIFTKKVLLN